MELIEPTLFENIAYMPIILKIIRHLVVYMKRCGGCVYGLWQESMLSFRNIYSMFPGVGYSSRAVRSECIQVRY